MFSQEYETDPFEAVSLGEKSYATECITIFCAACSLYTWATAAAHGTVCGAYFKDICMHSIGLAMFFNHSKYS